MDHPATFFGYREYEKPVLSRRGARLFTPVARRATRLDEPLERLAPKWFHWDLLGPTPYDYEVHSGEARDTYSDAFILTRFQTRAVLCTVTDNPAYLVFTYDGATALPERFFDTGFTRVESIRGFKIRNAMPGQVARYQVVALR